MDKLPAVFIHSDEIERFHYPPDSPFKTERAGRTKAILQSMGFYTGYNRAEVAPARAGDDDLAAFHTPEYIDAIKRVSKGDIRPSDLEMGVGVGDCPVFTGLYDYASLAVGASLTAARCLLDGTAAVAFNPSGGFHHAFPDKAGGFCYFNDIVIACDFLRRHGKKVFCLDLDAHHGNGTQAAFYSCRDVFTVSLHESGETLFPWGGFENETGEGEGKGFNVNLPFPAGTDDETYLDAFKRIVLPLVDSFNPDIVVIEIGMDILSVDPLTHLSMTNNVIADILQQALVWRTPLLVTGGGGYSFEDTARGWALAWCVLCGIEIEEDLYMGLGGVFLGNAEWSAGLRDKRVYIGTERKSVIGKNVGKSIEIIRERVFPVHNIPLT